MSYTEDRLLNFVKIHKNIQYVILGAGMDSFSLRNKDENIKIFELDHPLTQKYKLKRIKKMNFKVPNNVHFIPINFETENIKDILYRSNFDFKKPSFFSLLGVTYYLEFKSFEMTIKNVSKVSENASEFVFDFPCETKFEQSKLKLLSNITYSIGEHMKGKFRFLEIKDLLKTYGFTLSYLSSSDIQEKYLKKKNLTAYEDIYFMTAIKNLRRQENNEF